LPSDLDKRYLSQSSFVCHKFYLDDEVSRTATAPPSSTPVYNFRRQVTVDPMDAKFVQYIQEASMTFEVWSQPSDDNSSSSSPLASTPEPTAIPVASTPEPTDPQENVVVEPAPEPNEVPGLSLPVTAPAVEVAAANRAAAVSALRESLQPLKLSELKKRAAAAGMTAEQIEQVDDDDNPKAAMIELLVAAEVSETEETPREVRLERRVSEAESQAAEAAARVADLEDALEREKQAGAAARKALADAETRLTEQNSSACIVS
jgi:hypothetical protein